MEVIIILRRKWILTQLVIIMTFSGVIIAGCGQEDLTGKESSVIENNSILSYLPEETQRVLKSFDAEQCEYLLYGKYHFAGEQFRVTDQETIRAVAAAIQKITVKQEIEETATDYDDVFSFVMKDGTKATVCFNMHHLEVSANDGTSGIRNYILGNDGELWILAKELEGEE